MSFFRFYVIGLFLVFLYSNFGGCSCSYKPSKTQKDIDSELNNGFICKALKIRPELIIYNDVIKLGKDIPGDQNVDRVLATVDKIDGKNGLKVSESLVLYIINDYVHFFLLDVPYDNLDIDGKFLKISTSRIDPTCNNKFIIIFKNGGGGQSFYNII